MLFWTIAIFGFVVVCILAFFPLLASGWIMNTPHDNFWRVNHQSIAIAFGGSAAVVISVYFGVLGFFDK